MKESIVKNRVFMSVAALFCCALWGISTPIVKMGYAFADASHTPSLLLWAGFQFLVAGVLTTCIYSIACKKPMVPHRKSVGGILLISLFQTVGQYTLMYIGLLHTTAVKGAILKSTDVFFVMLIASLLFRQEKLTVAKVISCIVGFAGILVMNLDGLSLHINPLGDGLVVASVVAYSFSVVFTKRVAQDADPVVLCGYQMMMGGGVMLLIGLLFGGSVQFWKLLPIMLCLAAIYAVSYTLWTMLLKHHAVSHVSIHSFMTPVFGVIFSAFLLPESSGVQLVSLIAALVLVCLGIIIWGKSAAD